MPAAVYRMLTLLCTLVGAVPIGTNLGLLHLLWRLASGRRLASRGAVLPGLRACGRADRAIRRAWAALGQGDWTRGVLLAPWAALLGAEGRWQAHAHGGSRPVAVDRTGCWRPRRRHCPTSHDHGTAGRALPAIPRGLVARVGAAGGQRLALPLAIVRADPAAPTPRAHARALVREAVRQCAGEDALVLDAGFGLALLLQAGAARSVVRVAKQATCRRATPPPSGGRGRPPTRGAVVRPLPRAYRGRPLPATPPDRVATWPEDGGLLRAAVWAALVRPAAAAAGPPVAVVAVHDPRQREPVLLATPLALPARALRARDRDRWPVAHLPLAAKQLRGAARPCVHAPASGQRLPARALLAGAVLSSVAATRPAIPTGCGDRRPRPTPGRRRRLLARTPLPHDFPLPARLRRTASPTDHLPKGCFGQRRRTPTPAPPTDLAHAA